MALDLLLVDRDSQPWWLVPVSGMGAVCVGKCDTQYCVTHGVFVLYCTGMLYPVFVSESAADAPDGAKVIRCVAVFVGIYQASNVSSIHTQKNQHLVIDLPSLMHSLLDSNDFTSLIHYLCRKSIFPAT